MNGIALYFKFLAVSFRVQMQYPASFVLYAASNFAASVVELLTLYAFFARFQSLGAWSLPEVMLFYGMTFMAFALAEAYMRGFDTLDRHIRSGAFDRILLRPRSAFLQVLGSEFQLLRVGRFINGIIPFVWGALLLRPGWGIGDWLLIVFAIVAGSMTYGGVMLMRAAVSFFNVESLELFNIFTHGGVEASSYPMDVYTLWFRRLFTYVIPLAAINYWPMSILLRKHYAPAWAACLAPLLGVAFFALGYACWRFGVRHYRSTGS
ncbi:ABC transporter permease [Bacillota bacterium Meth-B3]